jgi:hypothetical protein
VQVEDSSPFALDEFMQAAAARMAK